MALQKNEVLNNGSESNYWKIYDFCITRHGAQGNLILNGYKDAQTRHNGLDGNVLVEKCFPIPENAVQELRDVILEAIYNHLKTLPEFDDAEDC